MSGVLKCAVCAVRYRLATGKLIPPRWEDAVTVTDGTALCLEHFHESGAMRSAGVHFSISQRKGNRPPETGSRT